jgi:hypothetical protein
MTKSSFQNSLQYDLLFRHDITEILLKVALNTIKQTKQTNFSDM